MIGDNFLKELATSEVWEEPSEAPGPQTIIGMAKELQLCRKIVTAVRAGRDKELHLLLVDYDILTSRSSYDI